jgi:hypothetical protein
LRAKRRGHALLNIANIAERISELRIPLRTSVRNDSGGETVMRKYFADIHMCKALRCESHIACHKARHFGKMTHKVTDAIIACKSAWKIWNKVEPDRTPTSPRNREGSHEGLSRNIFGLVTLTGPTGSDIIINIRAHARPPKGLRNERLGTRLTKMGCPRGIMMHEKDRLTKVIVFRNNECVIFKIISIAFGEFVCML